MAQDHRQKARRIFMEVADLSASDRAAALERTCGGDTKLFAEVEALLLANGQAGGFMKSPTSDKGDASRMSIHFEAGGAAGEQAGKQIGPYKLLELIGEGGFGSVWMAEQREPVKRRVALKLIKLGMDTKQVIARFEAERQALAMMDHPNIAKVLDAGSTEAGRPYFVMEYIRGIPILEYCDKERLNTRSRLDLFTNVCHAIQHAHQKGIIHRDIKPSNVLVTLHDGVAVPKVIDFGVAKATNSELTTKTLFTEHRQMIGTPAYMSPEQAEMSGLDIDTRSDIYSLGVLLYELLTGTTPFDVYDLMAKGYEEMMRIIREDEPHKPSTRISSLGDTSTRTASLRKVDVKTLGSLLRGDLDWIVMKCLEKDRSRRYETPNGLAADIKRHLSDEPVTARPPSAGYRLRKFVRRNRAGVVAGCALATALLVGVIAFAWQAKVAGEQRDLAVQAKEAESEQRTAADAAKTEAQQQEAKAKEQEAEAKKQEAEARKQEAEAEKQAAIAEAVARFQTDMLAAADPQNLLGDKVTVVQAMKAAVAELDKGSLEDQPLVEAHVRRTIGNTLFALGRPDDAEPNLRKSLAIYREAVPADHVAACLGNLAWVLHEQNELAEAEALYREALAINRAAYPAGHADIAMSLSNLAGILEEQNKLTEAEPLYREALTIGRATFLAGDPRVAILLEGLARLLQDQNKLAEAEPLLREALVIRRAALPEGHPVIALGLNNLGALLHVKNKLSEAESVLREALAINRLALSPGHPRLAPTLDNLAKVLQSLENSREAEPLMREALEIRRAALPVGHPDIALGLLNLAALQYAQNKLSEAEPLLRESLAIYREALPAGHPRLAPTLDNLAKVLGDQNKLGEAEPLMREALKIRRAALPAGHPDIDTGLNNLAWVLWRQNKLGEAEPLMREALKIRRAALPTGDPDIATGLNNLAMVLQGQNKLDEAEPLMREGLRIRHATLPAGHPHVIDLMSRLADLYAKQGKTGEALPLFREILESSRVTLPKDSPELAGQLANSSQALLGLKAWEEAEPILRECLVIREKAEPDDWRTFNTRSMLGAALLGQKKLVEAEPLLLAGYRGMKEREASIPQPGRVRIPDALERLVQLYEAKGNATEAAAWRNKLEAARAAAESKP